MLIAEQVLLLTLDPAGPNPIPPELDRVLAAALLIESVGTAASTVDDPLLAAAGEAVTEAAGESPAARIDRLAPGIGRRVVARLGERGILDRRTSGVVVRPHDRWPAADARAAHAARAAVTGVLVDGVAATPRAAVLVALVAACGAVGRAADLDGVEHDEIEQRARTVAATGPWPNPTAAAVLAAVASVAGSPGAVSGSIMAAVGGV